MATVAIPTTTAVQLNDGSAAAIVVRNIGTKDVALHTGAVLSPGSVQTVVTGGSAVTARLIRAGSAGSVDVTIPVAEPTSGTTYAPVGATVYAESYRNGVRTDAQILTAAFAVVGSGGALKLGQGTTYTLTAAQAYTLTASNVLIDGQGATIDGSGVSSGTILQIKGGTIATTTTLSAAVTARTKTLTVTSSTGFAAGDVITLRSSAEVFNADRTTSVKQEVARVTAVPNGTTLTLEAPTWNTYSITALTVTVSKLPVMRGLRVRDLTLLGAGGGSNQTGLQFSYFDGLRFSDVTVDGAGVDGLVATAGLDVQIKGCRVMNCNRTGTGYGIHVTEAHNVKIVDCVGRSNRHSVDVDEARDVLIRGCTAIGDLSAGLATHGSTDTVKFIGNTVKDCGGGIMSRGKNTRIRDNDIIGSRNATDTAETYTHGISLGDDGAHTWGTGLAGTGLVIKDNRIDISGPSWTSVDAYGIYCTSALVDAEISDNRITGYSSHGIYSKGDTGLRVKIKNNRLDGSSQLGTYGTTANHGIFLSPTHAVAGNTYNEVEIEDNRVSYALHSGIRVKGNTDNSGPVSDNVTIRHNIVGDSGVARVHIGDGYYGSRVEVSGNEWLGIASSANAVTLAATTFYLGQPFVGVNGWAARGRRPLGEGQQLGARMRPGLYYGPAQGPTAATALTLDRLCAVPIFVNRTVTVDRLALNVTGAGAASCVVRLGIYADVDDQIGGYPGALVSGSEGTVAGDGIAFVALTVSVVLTSGLYWLVAAAQGGTPTVTTMTNPSSQVVGYQAGASIANRVCYIQSSVSGALPAAFTTSTSAQGTAPLVQMRIV